MKEILLVRHAKSSWDYPGLPDIDRPLNKRGKRDAPAMASYVRELGIDLEKIVTSPARRARKTAQAFAKAFFGDKKMITVESDLYFGSESEWLDLIRNAGKDFRCIAYFSHNPTITYFSNNFMNGSVNNVPTCGVVHLISNAKSWSGVEYDNTSVEGFYFPKVVL